MAKRVLKWAVIAFLVFFVAYRSAGAAALVRSVGGMLGQIANGTADFFSHLAA